MAHKVAIVTGAGRRDGIGRATAVRLAEDGYAVVVSERANGTGSLTPAERDDGWLGARSVAEEITRAGGAAWARTCDVTDSAAVDALADFASDKGTVHVLVNNAGTPGEASTRRIHEVDDELWHTTFDINAAGMHRMVRAFVPLLKSGAGANRAIVNVSSTASIRVLPYFAAYPASKAAVDAITRQLAVELAPRNIRVNAVSPGSTGTDMMAGTFQRATDRTGIPDMREYSARKIPLQRLAEPREQAAAIAFLASDQASYITGQIIQVDGGLTLV